METEVNMMVPEPAPKKAKEVKTMKKATKKVATKKVAAKKGAKGPVAVAAKKATTGKRGATPGPRPSTLAKKIVKTGAEYKFHTGSQREHDFGLIKSGMTIEKYLAAGGRMNQLMLMSRCGLVEFE